MCRQLKPDIKQKYLQLQGRCVNLWTLPACTCNTLGTIDNQGCNVYTGECTCKRYVIGRDCNQCLPEHWGLSDDHDGCKACDCDPGGSFDNNCDVIFGQCRYIFVGT